MEIISEPPLVGDAMLPWHVVQRGFKGAPAGVTAGASGTITIGEAVVVGCREMVIVRVVVWVVVWVVV
jgi:hypothetical protein